MGRTRENPGGTSPRVSGRRWYGRQRWPSGSTRNRFARRADGDQPRAVGVVAVTPTEAPNRPCTMGTKYFSACIV
jgi:hypothetical protein